MNRYVVDASVSAKWFTDETHADAARSMLADDRQLHAPDLLLLEMDSVVCKWIRRGLVSVGEGHDVRAALRRCPVRLHPFLSLLDSAYVLAHETGRSIYDCLYVALAVLLDARVVTADRRLYDGLAGGPVAKHVSWIEELDSH